MLISTLTVSSILPSDLLQCLAIFDAVRAPDLIEACSLKHRAGVRGMHDPSQPVCGGGAHEW